MSGEIKEACARAFASVDVNGRGYISRDQMIMALRILNFNPIDSEVEEMLQENDNKSFTYDQFVDFVTDMKLPSLEEQKMDLREAFALFDRMNTGFILKNEFIEILTQCGEMKIDEKEAMSWAEMLDLHKDGKLRISELEELFVNDEDVQSIMDAQSWEMV
ncbi:uncharacterized protein LOC123537345 isoform X1 [Mercenaria mercenaria]|uniref:uncharacterized protein LOC123537345 isoform X1 n=1 Tax=Mercenaria mercenaria TaxID=6596 RepID=UPI001E1DC962|nr:uncharacterized protein LOC123537345 isoform X1 [Mercenaria mercenaria]XP_053385231.1 uncharacterized protein LOC123537345 isoform X1 [Mercenaria mercenaria]